MTNKKNGQPLKASHTNSPLKNSTAAAQRQRLLARLEQGPVDTLTARRELNILHPAGRIDELRNRGHQIATHRISVTDEHGFSHIGIALYVLRPRAEVAA